jgi:hypothetical protein
MYPAAIACGNAFILKPSERDPSAPMLAWNLFMEAGLPEGILQVIQATRKWSTAFSTTPISRPCPLSARPRSPNMFISAAPPMGSACRRWAAPRTT